ncbi:MAG: PrgI family protein [Patescibacteria group bacterium]
MRFTVPQFIEREAKIIGPLTFKQFTYIAIGGAVCFVVYQIASFYIFLISCVIFGGAGLALAFLQVNGRSLPIVFGNLLKFNATPKMYIWKKREIPIKILKKGPADTISNQNKEIEELPLKIAEKSQLKRLKTNIETAREPGIMEE